MKIAFLSKTEINIRFLTEGLAGHEVTPCRSRAELLLALPSSDVLVVQNQGFPHHAVDAECLRAARRLRLIQHHGVTCDATDAEEAIRLRIPIATIPGQNGRSVAEHAFFLLLALARQMRRAQSLVEAARMGEVQCTELDGKTLCVVGMGTIGKLLVRMAGGFAMRVVAVRRNPDIEELRGSGVDAIFGREGLREALSQADFVILALPLNADTFDLIGENEFNSMKSGALLVNVSRARHVNRAALEAALQQGRLRGFATDVFWNEPADPRDPLLEDERVIFTPHMGGKSYEAIQRSVQSVRDNIERLARGDVVLNLLRSSD